VFSLYISSIVVAFLFSWHAFIRFFCVNDVILPVSCFSFAVLLLSLSLGSFCWSSSFLWYVKVMITWMFNVICMGDAPLVHSFLLFVNSTVCFTLGRNICIRSPGQNWDEPKKCVFYMGHCPFWVQFCIWEPWCYLLFCYVLVLFCYEAWRRFCQIARGLIHPDNVLQCNVSQFLLLFPWVDGHLLSLFYIFCDMHSSHGVFTNDLDWSF